jgi:transposase
MSYSKDIRRLVINFVRNGGSKAEAARRFGVSRGRIYTWLRLGKNLETGKKPGPKRNRIVREDILTAAVKTCPDARLIELARLFSVSPSTISKALKRLRISRKKNMALRRN